MKRFHSLYPSVLFMLVIVFIVTALPVYGSQAEVQIITPVQGVYYDQWVSPQEATRWYTFDTTDDLAAMLVIVSLFDETGPQLEIEDMVTGEAVLVHQLPVTDMCVRFKSEAANYLITLRHPTEAIESFPYTMMWEQNHANGLNCPDLNQLRTDARNRLGLSADGTTDLLNSDDTNIVGGDCTVSPIGDTNVNIRQNASTNSPVVGNLAADTAATVQGITKSNAWLNVKLSNGGTSVNGWVATAVISNSGNCTGVQVMTTDGQLLGVTANVGLVAGDINLSVDMEQGNMSIAGEADVSDMGINADASVGDGQSDDSNVAVDDNGVDINIDDVNVDVGL